LYDFFTTVGCNPFRLILATDGNLYGTAGGVYRITLTPGKATTVTVLNKFNGPAGFYPNDLIQGVDGNFYGTTAGELGTIDGSVFIMTPTGTATLLDSLSPWADEAVGPIEFGDGLVQASDGNLYGVEEFGQTNDVGALFQAIPSGGFSILHDFGAAGAGYPETPPFQHTNGVLYGETVEGNIAGLFYSWNGGLPPFVSSVQLMGAVGSTVEILGQGFTSTSTVSFNGVAASATVQSGTSLFAVVPAGATTGSVTVTTSTGTLTSNRPFIVVP
jgi:hypothetical protein